MQRQTFKSKFLSVFSSFFFSNTLRVWHLDAYNRKIRPTDVKLGGGLKREVTCIEVCMSSLCVSGCGCVHVCVCVCVRVCVYMCVCTCVCVYMHVCICMCFCLSMCIYIHMCVCVCKIVPVCVHVCVYVCVFFSVFNTCIVCVIWLYVAVCFRNTPPPPNVC